MQMRPDLGDFFPLWQAPNVYENIRQLASAGDKYDDLELEGGFNRNFFRQWLLEIHEGAWFWRSNLAYLSSQMRVAKELADHLERNEVNERRASQSRAEAETILHKVCPSQILFDQAATKVRHIFSEFRLATKRFSPGVADKGHPALTMIFAFANNAPRHSTRVRPSM